MRMPRIRMCGRLSRPEQSNLPPNLSFTAKDYKYKVHDQIPFFFGGPKTPCSSVLLS